MIYFLRHGIDDESYIGGWSDAGLTEEGQFQVYEALDFIEKDKIHFDKIISSDIKRAVETASIIADRFNMDVELNSSLRELDKGKITGLKKDRAKELYPNDYKTKDINKRFPGGESLVDLYDRIKANLDYILSLDNVLIVTHRGVINMLYFILNDISLDYNKERFNVSHASIHELDTSKKLIRKIY